MSIGEISAVLKRQVGDQVYFLGSVSSDKAKGITFVPVIEPSKKSYVQENTENGYQRPGSQTRMRAFMRYLQQNPNSVVPPVLLSGRDGWRFVPSEVDKQIGKLVISAPAAIIDGQHRIGGYICLFETAGDSRPVDFILLADLDVQKEQTEFLTVNNTQKGVPKPLTVYLQDSQEAQLAWALNEEDDSPFKSRITRVGMGRQHLFALHSVAKQIERTFNHGKLADLDEDTKLDFLIRYWTTIADELEDEWADIEKLDDTSTRGRKDFEYKLLELTGFVAWSLIAPQILGRSFTPGIGMNWEHVKQLIHTCGHIDWRKDGQYGGYTGEGGAPVLVKEMERLLPADPNAIPIAEEDESE
jgi:DNA sulfur modification protein DndB